MNSLRCLAVLLCFSLAACESAPLPVAMPTIVPAPTPVSARASEPPAPTAIAVPGPTACLQPGRIAIQFAQYVPFERVSDILIELDLYWAQEGMSTTAGPNPYWLALVRVPAGKEQDTIERFLTYPEVDDAQRLRCDNGVALKQSTPAPTPTRSLMPTATRRPIPPTPTPDYLPTLAPVPTAAAVKANAVAFIAVDKLSGGPDTLWLANVDGSGQKRLLDDVTQLGYGVSNRLAWSPDGHWLAVTRRGGLWLVSRDGEFSQQLVAYDPQKGSVYLFAWSPDSRRIAFTQQFGYYPDDYLGLDIVDVGTGRVEKIARENPNAGWAYLLDWSPDGQHIAFAWGTQRQVISLAEHSAATPIPLCIGELRQWLWSPDGMLLARWEYGNGRYASGYLCMSTFRGQAVDVLPPQTDMLVYETNPVWSPDGQSLYMLASYRTPLDETRLMFDRLLRYDVAEQHAVQVASIQLGATNDIIAMSPNGQWLSIVEAHTDLARKLWTQSTIVLIAVDGTSVIRWPVAAPAASPLRWSADNRHLIFIADEYQLVEGAYVFTRQTLNTLDVATGSVTMLADRYQISAWAVSPIAN